MTDPFANAVVVSSETEEQGLDPFAGAVVVKEAPSVTVPDAYEEPKGDVASDVAQVLLKTGEGPTNVISDFFVNPFLKGFSGIDERAIDAISDEVLRNRRKSAFTALGSLMGVEQEEVLTPEGDYRDYATVAGPVGEIGTLLGGGIVSFSAFKKAYPKLSNFKNSLASGAVADSFFFQEGQGNISRLIEDSFEIETHFFKDAVEYLSTDEADPVLTQRFKEGLETVIVFGGAEKLIGGVFGITKKFIPSKDKSISEQAEELLTFIDENGNEIQIAKGNIHADVKFSPNPNSIAQIEQQASSRFRRFFNQVFTSRGYWTEEGDNLFRGKEYAHRQTVREAENIAGRLNRALDELPVDQLDEEKLTRALTEDLEFSPVASFEAKVEWVAADFNIPTDVAEDIVRTRELIDTLSARIFNSSVPSDEVRESIRQNIGEYMTRSYRLYEDSGYVPSESVVHNATKYIQTAMMQADETLEDGKAYEQAFIQVQEILKKGNEKEVSDFFQQNVKVNSSILEQRKKLPPEIRQLLGEIQNPTENIILSISKMSQLAENAEFGAKLLESGGGKYIFDEKRIFGSGNKQIIYNTKIEGTGTVLDGKYTTPEMATALAGRQSRFAEFESILPIRVFASAKASSQAMKTVASWTTHVRNAIGGLQFGLANGISPIGDAKAFSTLLNAALKRGDKGLDSLYEEYLGLGIINTNVRLNEFKTLFKDAAEIRVGTKSMIDLDPTYGAIGQAYKTADSAIKGATSKTYGALEAAYRATDDFFKIHAFEKELDFLKRANPDASIDDLKQEAARIIQDTFPNYDKVPNGIKALRFLPVGSFVSFPAEIIRTSVNIIQQGAKEIASDNPVIKQRGMQRLAGYIATNSVWAGSATAGAMFAGIGEEENEAVQRMAHTPWSKSPKIPVRWGDEIITIDTQFIDSYSTVKEPFMVMADRVMNGQLKEEGIYKALGMGVVEGLTKALAPYTDEAIVTEALTDIGYAVISGNGRTPTGEQLFPKDDPKAWLEAIPYLFDAFKPGVVKSIENIGIAADGELRPVLRTPKKDLETELVRNLLGIPTRLQKPEEVIYFAGGQYKKQSSETTRPSIAEDVEGEEYVEDMKKRYENLYSYQQDLYLSLDATLTFLGPARAQELLGKQIGKKAAFTILNNRFYLPEVPALEEFLRLKDVTAEEAIKYHSELINARNQAMYTRLIPVEEETQREMNGRDRLARGGEVTNVPQVPVEPDERIDKMTGLPYNQQAGAAFMDIEDPERRQQLFIGGLIQAVKEKLKDVKGPQEKAAEVLGISKEDLEWANSLGGKYGQREELDGRGDAARHLGLGWLAKQAKYPTAAKLAADAREILDVHGRKMDLANNQLGFDIAAKTRAEAEKKISEMIESKTASFMTPEESYTIRGYAKGGRVDKDKMACNKPRRTPNHPKKSHVVKACEDGKEKIIRFGEQGAKTAGKPKAGESARMKAKRKSFKARHRRNIKKGKMSAAYWADKTKW